ncbi:hypothetical protein SAMN04487787_110164 [Kosakonia sacchari]|nr:hypothetical protein SAMN04487787_110164 [Kosakonia sacchari]
MDDFMKYRYGWEKFHGAIHSLASEGTFNERLANAYVFNISHIDKENNLPEATWNKYEELVSLLTFAEPVGNEGKVAASIAQMDDLQKNKVAELFISLYDDLCRFMPNLHKR